MEYTDYQCYLIGCQRNGEIPLDERRFRLLQEEYLRWATERDLRADPSPIPQYVLEQLASLVAEGYKIAAGSNADGEEPGSAACGVREPRRPLEPVLAGSAARSLPSADTPDRSFWRT